MDQCLCGLRFPSAAHLTWKCHAMPQAMACRRPVHTAEERLLVPVIAYPHKPAVPLNTDLNELHQMMKQELETSKIHIVLATDGGAVLGATGRASISVAGLITERTWSQSLTGWDFSSLRVELQAMLYLLRAPIRLGAEVAKDRIHILTASFRLRSMIKGRTEEMRAKNTRLAQNP